MDETAKDTALSDLYAHLGHLLWRAAARVGSEMDSILPVGTDIHAYATLLALADEEPRSQSSLARMIGVSGTTLTSVAQSLQRDGLVERVRNPEDRRSYSLTRTTVGRAAVRRWAPHVDRLERRLTAPFTAAEATRLREILTHVVGDQIDEHTPQALLDNTGFLVTKAHQRAHREFMDALRPLDIEPRHFGTLRALSVVGPVTQGQVGNLLEVSPATVVQIVDHLERRGLLTRERDSADRRAYRLHLTRGAARVVEEASALSAGVLEARVGGPRSRVRVDLVLLLRRLLTDAAAG